MDYFPLTVELDYDYSLGALKPYFDALTEARALASVCPSCGKICFPPRLACDDDQAAANWKELEGTGEIVELTTGKDANGEAASFALIAMDGADNLCLGRLEGNSFKSGDRVRIHAVASDVPHPGQKAIFKAIP